MSGATGDDTAVDPDVIARRVRNRAEQTKRREVAVATAKLDGRYHEELEALSEQLTGRLLAGPLAALEVAAERDDQTLAGDVATLFGVDRCAETMEATGDDIQKQVTSLEH
ncbi:hypothetical protein [Halorhabdus utahensis]|uniref:hypothetical protein n=1 Tax=Halorhabdus utahensis TaxID=146826 RepID=UPI00019BB688|nr:hypothetical protein [Halorhabdus utahensis]